jgi:hypothetical protein
MGLNGIHRNHTWPIIGPEVALSEHWQLNAVYPVDMCLEYRWASWGGTGLALRPFLAIHRTTQHEPVPLASFQYRNFGVEYFIREKFRWAALRVSVGVMTGGELKVWNDDGHRLRLLKFRHSGYGEASLAFLF